MLIVIFVLAVFLRLIFLDTSFFFWDSSIYMLHAKLFAGLEVTYQELFQRPILISVLISPFARFAQFELLSVAYLSVLNSLMVFPMYFFGRLFSKKTGLIAAFLIAIIPVHIINSRWVMSDALAALFFIVSLYFFYVGLKNQSLRPFIIAGIFAGLAIATKFTSLLLLLMFAPFVLRKNAWISGLAMLITLVPFFAYSYLLFSNPFQVIINAFHVVVTSDPISIPFLIYVFFDTFGLLLVPIVLGFILLRKNKIFLYWSAISLFYFLFISFRGVVKPAGIEWEVERFLLLFLPFALIAASVFIAKLRLNPAVLLILLLLLIPFWTFERVYTPAVEFEDGLREATKEIAIFAKYLPQDNFMCYGNCPPIAYYADKNITIVYDPDRLRGLAFTTSLTSNKLVQFCAKNSCYYLQS